MTSIFTVDKDPALFSSVIWAVWNHRNNLRMVTAKERNLEALNFSAAPTAHRTRQTPTSIPAWSPPTSSWYKVNFDGATFDNENNAGFGVVIRNSEGVVMASLSQLVPLPSTVIEVEVLAARPAMELIIELGFDHVILEGYSEILIKALKNGGSELTQFGHLVNDIHFLASKISGFQFSHVHRQGNQIAHSLARRAILSITMSV